MEVRPLKHRMFRIPAIMVCSVVIFAFPACQDMFKGMGEMMVLQQKLAQEFNTQDIGVNLSNGTHLSVTCHSSQFAELPESEQALKAREIALFVRDHYEGYGKLSTISVAFVQKNQYGPVSVTKTQGVFSFKPSDLEAGLPRVQTEQREI
jgi:hypothetical protein